MKHKYFFLGVNIVLLAFYTVLLISLTSCGRRGDPVAIVPGDDKVIERKKEAGPKEEKKPEDTSIETQKNEQQNIPPAVPVSPTGLKGVYTQKSIVLTWDEVAGQDIRYRIYRSSGDAYVLAGETVTPAFTDGNVEHDNKYYYKVAAVGLTEGPPSKVIQIMTEVH